MRKILFISAALLLIFVSGCNQNNTALPEANKELVRQWLERLDRQDWTIYDDLIAPDAVLHSGGGLMTVEEAKQMGKAFYSAFPDFFHEIHDLIAEGDKVVVRATDYGTHKGEFNGIPPTGKKVSLGVIAIYRIKDGKIAEFWGEYDMLGLMQQLGMVLSAK